MRKWNHHFCTPNSFFCFSKKRTSFGSKLSRVLRLKGKSPVLPHSTVFIHFYGEVFPVGSDFFPVYHNKAILSSEGEREEFIRFNITKFFFQRFQSFWFQLGSRFKLGSKKNDLLGKLIEKFLFLPKIEIILRSLCK